MKQNFQRNFCFTSCYLNPLSGLTARNSNLDRLATKFSTVTTLFFQFCNDFFLNVGAGGPIMSSLLRHLGCEVIGLNLETTGIFAHKPEPVPENLGQLCEAVKQHKADLGIAVDPDVDRCVLIDENGVPLGMMT